MTIGRNIADLRKSESMTQEQLAEILGVSTQTISKWENGLTLPDIMLLPVIAECFHISIDELYTGKNPNGNQNSINYDDIPEIFYNTIIELTQRGCVDGVNGKDIDIDVEKKRMKDYLEENRQVKTAIFSNKNGAVIASSEIGLIHRGKANADQLTYDGIGRVLEVLSNTAVRKIFAYEAENKPKYITAAYAAKKCGLSCEEAKEALELLTEIHVNYPNDAMVDEDNSVRMYSLDSGEWVTYALMILKIARLIEENQQHYFNYRASYNNIWLN